jgi:hypothetical protein
MSNKRSCLLGEVHGLAVEQSISEDRLLLGSKRTGHDTNPPSMVNV